MNVHKELLVNVLVNLNYSSGWALESLQQSAIITLEIKSTEMFDVKLED